MRLFFIASIFILGSSYLVADSGTSTITYKPNKKYNNRRKIAIVSLYDKGYANIAKYADINKKIYAKKHRYSLFIYRDRLDPQREPTWNKIPVLQKHLANYNWILWTDADALIMNYQTKIESFIDDNYDIIIVKDFNGINLGNFLIKNSSWSLAFLKRWYSPENHCKTSWLEQCAFIQLYESDPDVRSHVKIIPSRTLNSYSQAQCPIGYEDCLFQPGDFIIHFAGLSNKENLMKLWYEESLKLLKVQA